VKDTRSTIHGTLLFFFNRGVLILGESGAGKSRIAGDIISHAMAPGQCGLVRSARLVADDIVTIETTPDGIVGTAPGELFGLLELSGMGIIDVHRVFGPSLVRPSASVDVIVSLEDAPDGLTAAPGTTRSYRPLMGHDIPVVHLAAGVSGDTVAAAVAQHILIEAGVVSPVLDALLR
jgi:HPr kinase/phosphorylase